MLRDCHVLLRLLQISHMFYYISKMLLVKLDWYFSYRTESTCVKLHSKRKMSREVGDPRAAPSPLQPSGNAFALCRLQVETTFQTWKDLRRAIVDHGVASERVIVIVKNDRSRLLAKCRMHCAPNIDRRAKWSIKAMVKANLEDITITKATLMHVCETADHYIRRMHNNSDRLANHIMEIVIKNRATRASTRRDTAQALVHPDIRYHTAHSSKKRCVTRLDGLDTDSFHLIPAHGHHILERDLGVAVVYSAPDHKFKMLFVCPFASCHAWGHLRPFVGFDGTHTKCSYPQISSWQLC